MKPKFPKIIYLLVCFLLIFEQSGFAQVAGELNIAGHLSAMHNALFVEKFRPLHLRYISYDNLNNNFKLLLDQGDFMKQGAATEEALKDKSKELLNYFFIGISLPNESFWVNLRSDSPDNIIESSLAQTDLGKVLLEADLQLKKDTANFTSPQTPEGKVYWDKLYRKAGELFGTENITIPTLTRPWIVPNEIIIRESTDNAYIYKATLKVMLEQDYLKDSSVYNFTDERLKQLNEYSSQLIRETIIPRLTKDINTAKRYAPLRQVYYSLILSQWFKQKFYGQAGLYSHLINKQNLTGLTSKETWSKDTYFQAYQKSFKEGEYNIKEQVYSLGAQTIRTYMSGGIALGAGEISRASSAIASNRAGLPQIKFATGAITSAGTMDNPFGLEIQSMPQTVTSSPVSAAGLKKAISTVAAGMIISGASIVPGVMQNNVGAVDRVPAGITQMQPDKGSIDIDKERELLLEEVTTPNPRTHSAIESVVNHNPQALAGILKAINIMRSKKIESTFGVYRDDAGEQKTTDVLTGEGTSVNVQGELKSDKTLAVIHSHPLWIGKDGKTSIIPYFSPSDSAIIGNLTNRNTLAIVLWQAGADVFATVGTAENMNVYFGNLASGVLSILKNYPQESDKTLVLMEGAGFKVYKVNKDGSLSITDREGVVKALEAENKPAAGSSPVDMSRRDFLKGLAGAAGAAAVALNPTAAQAIDALTQDNKEDIYSQYRIRNDKEYIASLQKKLSDRLGFPVADKYLKEIIKYSNDNDLKLVKSAYDELDKIGASIDKRYGVLLLPDIDTGNQAINFGDLNVIIMGRNLFDYLKLKPELLKKWLAIRILQETTRMSMDKQKGTFLNREIKVRSDSKAAMEKIGGIPRDCLFLEGQILEALKAIKENVIEKQLGQTQDLDYDIKARVMFNKNSGFLLLPFKAESVGTGRYRFGTGKKLVGDSYTNDEIDVFKLQEGLLVSSNSSGTFAAITLGSDKQASSSITQAFEFASSPVSEATALQEKPFSGEFSKFTNINAQNLVKNLKEYAPLMKDSEPFRHVLRILLKAKENRKNSIEVHRDQYPYVCQTLSNVTLGILQDLKFNARRVEVKFPAVEYPTVSIERHFYVIATIAGKDFIVDIAADQFEPLGNGGFADLGVVVLPLDIVNMNPERFWMYTGKKSASSSVDVYEAYRREVVQNHIQERAHARSILSNLKGVKTILISAARYEQWGEASISLLPLVASLARTGGDITDITVISNFPDLVETKDLNINKKSINMKCILPNDFRGLESLGNKEPDLIIGMSGADDQYLNMFPGIQAIPLLQGLITVESIDPYAVYLERIRQNLSSFGLDIPETETTLTRKSINTNVILVNPHGNIFYGRGALGKGEQDIKPWAALIYALKKQGYQVEINYGANESDYQFSDDILKQLKESYNETAWEREIKWQKFDAGAEGRADFLRYLSNGVEAVVTIDTAVYHLARFYGIPTVVFTGYPSAYFIPKAGKGFENISYNDFSKDPSQAVGVLGGLLGRKADMDTTEQRNVSAEIADSGQGGIDFRALPVITQPMASLSGQIAITKVPAIPLAELNKEWEQIENMLNAGITPSSDRIKDYLQSCAQKENYTQDIDKVLSCIADILRAEEDKVISTEPGLKGLLMLIESDRPANEMQLALTKITIEAKEPKALKQ